jgi:hypothetical protein
LKKSQVKLPTRSADIDRIFGRHSDRKCLRYDGGVGGGTGSRAPNVGLRMSW